MDDLIPYLFIFIGLVVLVLPFLQLSDNKRSLKSSGVHAEGIIFRIDGRQGGHPTNFGMHNANVQVRFVTKSMEWITGPIHQDFQLSFLGQYKDGDKVDIYYNSSKPNDFFVDSKQNPLFGKLILMIVGLVLIVIGLWKLFF